MKIENFVFDELEVKKQQIREFVLWDDTFFSVVMEDKDACEEMISVITQRDDLKIIENKTQFSMRNADSKSTIIDLLAVDSNNKRYCIEIQKEDSDDEQRRVRYIQANTDVMFLDKGADYKEIPDVITIFISRYDPFNRGIAVYHVNRYIKETGDMVRNGREEIYVNGKSDDGSLIAELMNEFSNRREISTKFRRIAQRVRYLKFDEKGVSDMCEKMQRIVDIEVRKAVEENTIEVTEKVTKIVTEEVTEKVTREVTEEVSLATARKLIQDSDFTVEKIADITNLSVSVVEQLKREMK